MSHTEAEPLIVIHDFEAKPSGVALSEWPLHFTVTPFFTPEDISESEAILAADTLARSIGRFTVRTGERVMYGPNDNVPATKLIDTTGTLTALHTSLILDLRSRGCEFSDLIYALDNYSPHISDKTSAAIIGMTYQCTSLSIAKKLPKNGVKNKVILHEIDL